MRSPFAPLGVFCGVTLRAGVLVLWMATPAAADEPAAGRAQASESLPDRHERLTFYGRLDFMYYRYRQDRAVEAAWNLNGLRDTVVGLKTAEHKPGSQSLTPVVMVEAAYGADRGSSAHDYTVSARQAFAGVAGDWGKVTYGRQYSVMTNIAWSVLNPVAQGWGSNFNDLLYAGDPFTYGQRDAADVRSAGSNFFYGYAQTGLIYQRQEESHTLEADYVPADAARGKGRTIGLGGTFVDGKLTLAGAVARQRAALDRSHRDNHVLGLVYALTDRVSVHLARLASNTSAGARYVNLFGGASWGFNDKMTFSAAISRYRQNSTSAYGAGSSLGYATVLEYAVNDRVTLYLETDRRSYHGADDGLELRPNDRAQTLNTMAGLHLAF